LILTKHIISISITLVIVAIASVYTLRFVKSSDDFCVGGRKLGSLLVGSSLVGAFVGGTSTVGTAQVAYIAGFSGIWFTLGAGVSCFLLAFLLAKPLRNATVETIPQLFCSFYGNKAANWTILYITIGTLIQIAAQVLAAIPILTLILNIPALTAGIIIFILILFYSIFGGLWSTSLLGVIKTFLLNTTLFAAGFLAYKFGGGYLKIADIFLNTMVTTLDPTSVSSAMGAIISVTVGFISTQSYLQVIFSASSVKSAQRGSFLAGILIILTGISCTIIGMFMRSNSPQINAAEALPLFIINYLNPWLGGVILATLILSLVMTGAALVLGVATILTKNIFQKIRPAALDKELIWAFRVSMLLIAFIVMPFALTNLNSLILQWAFISMALRGVTVFLPLIILLFFKDRFDPKYGEIAIIIGPALVLLWAFLGVREIDALYPGLIISVIILGLGYRRP